MKYSVNGARIVATQNETLVAGALGAHVAEFTFDGSWNEYVTRKAVFKCDDVAIEMLIVDGVCEIPWEVLAQSGTLLVGVYGESAEKRRPTLWASPKTVNAGTIEGDNTREPTPDEWQQLLESIASVTPHIGQDGNWYVGEYDTGVAAQGESGVQGEPGADYVLTDADKTEIAELAVSLIDASMLSLIGEV